MVFRILINVSSQHGHDCCEPIVILIFAVDIGCKVLCLSKFCRQYVLIINTSFRREIAQGY